MVVELHISGEGRVCSVYGTKTSGPHLEEDEIRVRPPYITQAIHVMNVKSKTVRLLGKKYKAIFMTLEEETKSINPKGQKKKIEYRGI